LGTACVIVVAIENHGKSQMNLIVFGATGRTGRHLVNQAFTQGHVVTAFVRDLRKLNIQHERLHVIQGDVLDINSIEKAIDLLQKSVRGCLTNHCRSRFSAHLSCTISI
jgi:putative NADH-flavin reductase